jgi:CheY-like chemotaxis protein
MAKILVVDDEPDGRQVMAVYLRRLGYFVAEAASADAGMRKLLDDWPDAVVLDVRMPGVSGVDMLEVIRSYTRWQSLPVLIVTAHATPDEIRRAREQGVVEVFEKSSYRLDELGDALAAVLGPPGKGP